jgi:DNA-binding MarR family transcriptional regulator
LTTLEDADYVTIERPLSELGRRVRARLTPVGRKRFTGHVAALQGIIANAVPEA